MTLTDANFAIQGFQDGSASSSMRNQMMWDPSSASKDIIVHIYESQSSATSDTRIERDMSDLSAHFESLRLSLFGRIFRCCGQFWDRNTFGRASNFVHEWTPFLLVTTYFISSIFAYMLFPAKLINVFWFI